MIFRLSFMGRERGAIGMFHAVSVAVEAPSAEDAREMVFGHTLYEPGGPPPTVAAVERPTAIDLLEAEAHRAEMPKHFAGDIVRYDRATLAEYRGPFVWVLYESGTHLLKPGALDLVGTIEGSFGPSCRWYHYDGARLCLIENGAVGARKVLREAQASRP